MTSERFDVDDLRKQLLDAGMDLEKRKDVLDKVRSIQEYHEVFRCVHRPRPRLYTIKDGRQTVVLQCVHCGHMDGNGPMKKSFFNLDELEEVDLQIRDIIQAEKRSVIDRLNSQAGPIGSRYDGDLDDYDEWSNWYYKTYLKSQEWSERRQEVLNRSGGVCEGCRKNKATLVHHLDYDTLKRTGKELLFELVALCSDCHARAHYDKHPERKW